ncbi:hypothetical protein BD769DRAFT_1385155 [Suillus cothurnatus]|nr:hypothetical protein BD769DRAFT_1385155 [Suillus cothurnatus]
MVILATHTCVDLSDIGIQKVVGTSLVILLRGSTWLHSTGSPNQVMENVAYIPLQNSRHPKHEGTSSSGLEISSNMKKKTQMQPSAEQVRSDYEALSDDFPYDAEQQSITAISPPPLEDLSYEANDSVLTPLEDFSYEADDSILTIDNNLPCSCDTPALQVLKTIVGQWRKEWESESMWNKVKFFEMSGIVQNSLLENFEEGEHFNDQNQIYIIELKLKECVAASKSVVHITARCLY